jgi:hypothetical protein
MGRRAKTDTRRWIAAGLLVAAVLAACSTAPGGTTGEELLADRCAGCHDVESVVANARTREEWEGVVTWMTSYGLEMDDEERSVLLDYLARTYGP